MTLTCDYCKGPVGESERKCASCGAPFVAQDSALPDFRVCPACHRRLLALGSPACNYCGRRLPDSFLKARESDLKRLTQVNEGEETSEVGRKVDELIRQTVQSKTRRFSWSIGPVDITGIIDLFR